MMTKSAQQIMDQLTASFPILRGKLTSPRPNRIYAEPVSHEEFEEILDYLYHELEITFFHVVVGLHTGDNLEFAYVLSHRDDKVLITIKQVVPIDKPVIKTVTDKYMNALWHERELVDLFGAVVQGLPPGLTYPLPDGWPKGNYPLRKDWKVEYFDRQTMTYNPPPPVAEKAAPAKQIPAETPAPLPAKASPPAGTAPADLAAIASPQATGAPTVVQATPEVVIKFKDDQQPAQDT